MTPLTEQGTGPSSSGFAAVNLPGKRRHQSPNNDSDEEIGRRRKAQRRSKSRSDTHRRLDDQDATDVDEDADYNAERDPSPQDDDDDEDDVAPRGRNLRRKALVATPQDPALDMQLSAPGPAPFNIQGVRDGYVTGAQFLGEGFQGRLRHAGESESVAQRLRDRATAKAHRAVRLSPADDYVFRRVYKSMWFDFGLFISAFPNEKYFTGIEDAEAADVDVIDYMTALWRRGIDQVDPEIAAACTPAEDIFEPEHSNIPYHVSGSVVFGLMLISS